MPAAAVLPQEVGRHVLRKANLLHKVGLRAVHEDLLLQSLPHGARDANLLLQGLQDGARATHSHLLLPGLQDGARDPHLLLQGLQDGA
jgi:hypothetical protein